jgi:DNA-directed RNA polymerase beta' subunit
MKLHHTSESKGQARASGAYTSDEAPAKGGATGSKRISLIDSNALLAHGATQVLRDAAAVRGQRNDDYWLRFMQGHTPRDPDVPMVYDKFLSQLRAAGVNTWREGSKTHLLALTNKDVDALVGPRELSSGDTVRFDRGLEPVAGGLFDPHATGGHGGRKWAAVRLHEPLLNPVMEEPARRLLGLTQRQLEEVIAGDRPLAGAKGPGALRKALAGLDVDAELARARQDFKHGSASGRDDAARRVGYLKTLKERGLDPADWVLDRVPVLPPAFRPVSVMGDSGTPLVADANWLYKELIEANDNLGAMAKEVGDGHVGPERLALYQAFKAVTGLGDPVGAKTKEKQIKGILKAVLGTSPKLGTVQRRLISSTVDNVGRAVITPDPSLDMDHVGLPEDMAFKVYEKFVVRRLARRGLPVSQALREVRERTPRAREELVAEMDHRPVLVNRAPVLHKFGIMAHRPVLVAGSTLRFSPLVTKGYGADFDGDAVQFHVPTDEGARAEALERLLPSRSLLSPADFKTPVHMPSQEYVAGLYHATSPDAASDRPPRVFKTKADLSRAYAAGQVDANDRVTVLEH